MTITNTWNVQQMDCYPEADGQTDVVFTVHWTLNATDGIDATDDTYSGSTYGSVGLPAPTGAYTPYADLTLAQVVGWVQNALGAEAVAANEASVAAQIEAQINPPVVTPPLPWVETNA